MDSPITKQQKRNDYNRHKLFRKIKRRQLALHEKNANIAEKELKKSLRRLSNKPTYGKGKDGDSTQSNQIEYPRLIDTNYDQMRAMELGYIRGGNGHYPSRDYITGDILKYPTHPTFLKALLDDARMGYYPTKDHKPGRSRTDTWKTNALFAERLNNKPQPTMYEDGKSSGVIYELDNPQQARLNPQTGGWQVLDENGKPIVNEGGYMLPELTVRPSAPQTSDQWRYESWLCREAARGGRNFSVYDRNSYDKMMSRIARQNEMNDLVGYDGTIYHHGSGALLQVSPEFDVLALSPALRPIIANAVKKGTNLIVPRVAGAIGSYADNRSGLFFKNIADFAEDIYNATSSKNLGRFYRYRDINPRVEGDVFGDYIAEGSERTVFNDARNSNAVLKVEEGNFYPSRPWQIQNRIKYDPILTPEHVEGYVKNMTGRKGYMRTTSLAKVKTFDPDSDTWIEQLKWMDKNKDRIIKKFQDSGWSVYLDDSGSIAYARKGNKILNDIAPYNVGENNVGDIEFFDLNLLDYNPKLMSKNSVTIAPIMK